MTLVPCICTQARLAQLVERKALNLVVVGSSPTVGIFSSKKKPCGSRDQIRRMRLRYEGPVAQWIRHRSTEPEIVGSSPTRVIFGYLRA